MGTPVAQTALGSLWRLVFHVKFYVEKIRAVSCSSTCSHSPECMGKSTGQTRKVMSAYVPGVAWDGISQTAAIRLKWRSGVRACNDCK